ncbi:ATPase [Beutenbergia cavernae DSM 12333]|uniref:ATPase n=1 Tax=Beutenbergia cavernae (strain ATCC BAA-8 / DSM 12333 / CCUG 43141 / JCM 11478 / NBRC 16432 / NCIMB 13614 / HKI 0122) TaxID=471853 RepID=C5BVE5_BEUC1|nr:AAA family ATPase [Beutenbergia cavernae]ACQ80532.1 ATPase [Beutenbergia cavernae DSM 12333]
MIETLAVEGYRSLRDVVVPLGRLTVVTGANGTGKSSLYRAMRLLADAGSGDLIASLARSGGLDSVRWAGPEVVSRAMRAGEVPVQGTVRSGPVRLRLGVSGDSFGYAVDLGLPTHSESGRFPLDPRIKAEAVWSGSVLRPATSLVERAGAAVRIRDGRTWAQTRTIAGSDSILTELAGSDQAHEVREVRERLRGWRFYDHLRTDPEAPAREARLATRTPVLAHDGADVAAALATIEEIGREDLLADAVAAAFDGSRVEFVEDGPRLGLALRQAGMLRPLAAAELSDGTVRYLMLVAALLTPRPPELLVLNEPETSLHPDLLPSLAQLVVAAAEEAQVVLLTHAAHLVDLVGRAAAGAVDLARVELAKDLGETVVVGQGRLEAPPWQWPKR